MTERRTDSLQNSETQSQSLSWHKKFGVTPARFRLAKPETAPLLVWTKWDQSGSHCRGPIRSPLSARRRLQHQIKIKRRLVDPSESGEAVFRHIIHYEALTILIETSRRSFGLLRFTCAWAFCKFSIKTAVWCNIVRLFVHYGITCQWILKKYSHVVLSN